MWAWGGLELSSVSWFGHGAVWLPLSSQEDPQFCPRPPWPPLSLKEEKNSAQPHPATHRGRQGAENPSSAEHIPHLSSEGATRLAPSGKERRSRPRRWRTYTRTHVRTKRFQHPGLAQTRCPHLRHPSLPAAFAARWRRGAARRGGLWRARRPQSPTEGVSKMGAPGLSPESHTKQDPGHPPGREATGCSR